jgi:transcriptional regulator with XRE-family HTH domain
MGQDYATESYYVADKIRQIRERAGISQEELADRLRISPMTVHRIESGKRQLPVGTLLRFSDTMGIPVSDLLPCKDPQMKQLEMDDLKKRFSKLNPANQKVVHETLSTLVNSLLLTQ